MALRKKLILILCSPRTGSSMVAQVFWRHGCWVDRDSIEYSNVFGYTSYENRYIKDIARRQWAEYHEGRQKVFGVAMQPAERHIEAVAAAVDSQVKGDPWLFKTSVEMYPLFLQFQPRIVLVRRNEDAAVASMAAKQAERGTVPDRGEIRAIHRRRMDLMARIEREHGAAWVDTDEMIAGDYGAIEAAVNYCGLEYDERLVEQSIDAGKWNFAA